MVIGSLPEEGELQLGTVSLPAGKWVRAGYELAVPVAWVTRENVPDAGRVWAALSDARQQTGLVPFLLGGMNPGPGRPWEGEEFGPLDVSQLDPMDAMTLGLNGDRPWDADEFGEPADVTQLDRMDAASLLRRWWDGQTREVDEGEEEDEEFVEYIKAALAPFSRQFPGLAPSGDEPLSPEELAEVLGSLPAARIGLVPAARPADVLPLIGWSGTANRFEDALPVAAVLRSWEDRFGARLLQVGFAWISLLVTRPARSIEHAQRIAAEHYGFCSECADHTGLARTTIPEIAPVLVNAPIWSFWWD